MKRELTELKLVNIINIRNYKELGIRNIRLSNLFVDIPSGRIISTKLFFPIKIWKLHPYLFVPWLRWANFKKYESGVYWTEFRFSFGMISMNKIFKSGRFIQKYDISFCGLINDLKERRKLHSEDFIRGNTWPSGRPLRAWPY